MTPKYRPDIDGLRAIAVLSIVFFHLGIDAFGGGYVGVDIFFVISGYLITSIIIREMAAGEFSIARFYERRVRRILPALTVTLVATLAAGLVLSNPEQLEELGRSAAATAVFSSNIFFFLGSGYFEGPSELKPLLHTWSLAVEEQYYILFPFLLLLIAKRFSGSFGTWLITIGSLSFIACIVVTRLGETAAFYLIPFRAWELLIGSVLALKLVPRVTRDSGRNLLSLTGLTMMLVSVFVFTHDTPFPGAAAALPTIGTAMIIHAGADGGTWVNRVLSVRPMVFFGLISYSLYLWHWPVVVYAKQYLINEPTDLEAAIILLAVLLLATLSWKYVESPFRNRQRFAPRERLFAMFAAISAVVLSASLAIVFANGFPNRDTGGSMNDVVAADPGWQHWKDCEEAGEKDTATPELCGIGRQDAPPTFLFWGDSHALALASSVNLSAGRRGVGGLLAIRTGCPPLRSIDRPGQRSCHEFNEAILRYVSDHPEIETVILAARWALSTNGTRYKNEDGRSVTLVEVDSDEADGRDNVALFELGLRRTLEALERLGRNVVLVNQVPEVGYDVPSVNYTAKLTGRDVNSMIAPSTAEYRERTASVTDVLNALRAERSLRIVDPSKRLCDGQYCNVVVDGTPLYRDDNHLSLLGCVFVSSLFDSVFAES